MSEVREGYKMTELGEIPSDWKVTKIIDVAETMSGGTPNRSKKEYFTNGSIPWIKTGELKNKYVNHIEEYITKDAVENSSAKLIPKNTLIVAMYGATIGQMSILNFEATSNQACCAIMPSEELNVEFLYYSMKFTKKKLIELGAGGAQPNISQVLIRNFKIKIPPLEEQQKIADILSTVDTQIEQTEQMIEQTKELKHGLMQQLLTKGIGHTEFKESELGEIPVPWGISKIVDVAETMSGGTPNRSKKEYYINGSIPWIKTGELKNKYIQNIEEYITEDAVKNSSAKLISEHALIVAMYGATIGQMSILEFEATSNQACCAIIPSERLIIEYLYYFMKFTNSKLIQLGAGGAQPNISQVIIKNFKIKLPPLEEQQKIAEILSSVDDQIDIYEKEKEKYEELKKGLMQQLLTGKIRVKVDE